MKNIYPGAYQQKIYSIEYSEKPKSLVQPVSIEKHSAEMNPIMKIELEMMQNGGKPAKSPCESWANGKSPINLEAQVALINNSSL